MVMLFKRKVPGGEIHPGETPEDRLRRELPEDS
jgi:hypothetical protein